MNLKLGMTNILLQAAVVVISGFLWATQMPSLRQPSKLGIQITCVVAVISLVINIVNYVRMGQD